MSNNPLNRILEILRFEKKEISSIYFYAALAGLVQLSLPLGIQAIISFVLGGAISTSLVLLIISVVFGVFVNGLLQVNKMKIIEKIQQQLFVRYSFKYAHHINNIDIKGVKDYYLPELVNRFFDVVSLQKGIAKLLLDVPTATIQILFGLLLLSFYHPTFIFFGILLVTILYTILRYTGSRGLETSMAESNHKYKVAAYLEEEARMVSSFKFVDTSFLLKKADSHISNYLRSRTAHFRILLIQYWSLIVFKLLITAAMLIVGAFLLVNQQLNIGQFIAAEIVIILVINSVEKLIVNLEKVYDVLTSLEKLNKLLDKPAERTGHVVRTKVDKGISVSVDKLHFTYGDKDVLKDVSFDVAAGQKVCITGTPGSGKTTLLYLLSGIYTPEKGEITLDEVPIHNYDLPSLRKDINVLFSETDIISASIMENITLGQNIDYAIVDNMAELTGLRQYVVSQEEGYEKIIQPSAYHLPDNVIQKILLTRILVSKPKLMLLEALFDKIAPEYRRRVLQYIHNEMKDTTVVITATECMEEEYFDKIIRLDNGSIKTDN
ncbi:hypothetical protein CAP35_05240 [Chitinophagaceae bacterium IBVUCB1]|nr:hypothetical protein CAP35_05240 [Chitinophagaceae bacterium IBVUCB1]